MLVCEGDSHLTETVGSFGSSSDASSTSDSIIRIVDLQKHFLAKLGFWQTIKGKKVLIRALDGVSLDIKRGEIYGLVGESGCGKTTVGRAMLRLIEPTSGSIFFKGNDITHLSSAATRTLRSKMQMVFQDPYESINPRMSVFDVIADESKFGGNPRQLMWESRTWSVGTQFDVSTVYRSNWLWEP